MFVDAFEKLCEENGIAPSRVLDNLGITRSAYSRWSKGGSPSNETKKKIADHFGITVAELMSGEIKKAGGIIPRLNLIYSVPLSAFSLTASSIVFTNLGYGTPHCLKMRIKKPQESELADPAAFRIT